MTDSGCPYHERIEYCPLYIASHEAFGDGCVRQIGEPCAAAKNAGRYFRMLGKVRARDPGMVSIVAAEEAKAARLAQIQRNMRLLGMAGARPN